MKIKNMLILFFALALMSGTAVAEARHHCRSYNNGFYGNGYGGGSGWHRSCIGPL